MDTGITATYISANSFSVVGDRTDVFQAERRIRLLCGSTVYYGKIVSAVYTSLTTVVVSLDSGSLDATLTYCWLGIISPVNTSMFLVVSGTDGMMDDVDKISFDTILQTYITSAGVTFENLNNNGDVGTGATQVAQGNHNHDAAYLGITAKAADSNLLNGLGGSYYSGLVTTHINNYFSNHEPSALWTERTIALVPSGAGAGDNFGYSCALSKDGLVMAVGAIAWDGGAGADQGAVYVFDWNGSSWVERTTALTPSDAGATDNFGSSVALSSDGTVLAVGSIGWDGGAGTDQGAVYVFDWNGLSWVERTTALVASDAADSDLFGRSCALSSDGTVLAVGAIAWDDGAGSNQGAIYIYDWSGSSWVERTTALVASDAGDGDFFGRSCALSSDGTVLAVGAIFWDGGAGSNQGAAYVFDWNGSSWVERTTALVASDAGDSDFFGQSCALSSDGTVLAVGAIGWDGGAGSNQGAIYIYDWSGSSWVERTTALVASDAGDGDNFSQSCALSSDGTVLAVGSVYWDGGAGVDQGAVYVFDNNAVADPHTQYVLETNFDDYINQAVKTTSSPTFAAVTVTNGATGSFIASGGEVITVTNGIITSIV